VRTLFKCKSTCLHVHAYARARVRPFRAYACARVASNIRASSCSDAVSRWLASIVAATYARMTDDTEILLRGLGAGSHLASEFAFPTMPRIMQGHSHYVYSAQANKRIGIGCASDGSASSRAFPPSMHESGKPIERTRGWRRRAARRARRECIVFFVSASLYHVRWRAHVGSGFMKPESDSRRVIPGLADPRDLPHRANSFARQLFALRADKRICELVGS